MTSSSIDQLTDALRAGVEEIHVRLVGPRHADYAQRLLAGLGTIFEEEDPDILAEFDEPIDRVWFPSSTVLRVIADDWPESLILGLVEACASLSEADDLALVVEEIDSVRVLPRVSGRCHEAVVVWGAPGQDLAARVQPLVDGYSEIQAAALGIAGSTGSIPYDGATLDAVDDVLQRNPPLHRPTVTWYSDEIAAFTVSTLAPSVNVVGANADLISASRFTSAIANVAQAQPAPVYVGANIDLVMPQYGSMGFTVSRDVWEWKTSPPQGLFAVEWPAQR